MNRVLRLVVVLLCLALPSFGQRFQTKKKPVLTGMYFQWGYNRDKFTKSKDGDNYDFTIHKAYAKDQPDFSGFRDTPLDITIPQNSYRIGFYLNPEHTWAIEINFDHAKFVIEDNQTLRVTGQIHGNPIDKDTFLSKRFLHFEHTNGANFYNINYVTQQPVWKNKKRTLATVLGKVGAGVVIPKSDITLMGNQLDNKYHIAGYIVNGEMGSRFFITRNLFLEANVKAGFANYLNVLTVEGGTARHNFFFAEVIGLLGYDFNFGKYRFKHHPKQVN